MTIPWEGGEMFKKSTIIAFLLGWGVLGFFIGPRDVIGWVRGGRTA